MRLRPRAAALLAALLVGAGLLAPACARSPFAGTGIRPSLLGELTRRAERVRGLSLGAPLEVAVIGRAESGRVMRSAIERSRSEAQLRAHQDGLSALGLWPPERDLLAEVVALSASAVAGFYVAPTRALYLVREPLGRLRRDPELELTLTHEILHALQHEAYPQLFADDAFAQSQDDAMHGVAAAREGDALLYAFAALDLAPPSDPGAFALQLEIGLEGSLGPALADAPALLQRTLAFPYAHGYPLAFREGRDLLERPPASTEQVLHAERRREPFEAIDLSPLRALLPAGCRAVAENTVGELGLSVLFGELSGAPSSAWEGWDGDRYLAVRCPRRGGAGGPGQTREFAWLVAWDSAADAAEFEAAYRAIAHAVRARAGASGAALLRRAGREVVAVTPRLAHLADALPAAARRRRVATLAGLRAHFEASPATRGMLPASPPGAAPRGP